MCKLTLVEIVACVVLGMVLGIAFWLFYGEKACKKTQECPGGLSGALEMASKSKIVEVYQGKWHKDYLEVVGK